MTRGLRPLPRRDTLGKLAAAREQQEREYQMALAAAAAVQAEPGAGEASTPLQQEPSNA